MSPSSLYDEHTEIELRVWNFYIKKNDEWIFMKERRKEERLKEYNEIAVTVISDEKNLPKDKISYNYSEDISVSGAKIRGNIPLPVDTLLQIDLSLKNFHHNITTIGKVKWIKNIIENKWCEAGVEFVNTPSEVINKLEDHIFCKQEFTSHNTFELMLKS